MLIVGDGVRNHGTLLLWHEANSLVVPVLPTPKTKTLMGTVRHFPRRSIVLSWGVKISVRGFDGNGFSAMMDLFLIEVERQLFFQAGFGCLRRDKGLEIVFPQNFMQQILLSCLSVRGPDRSFRCWSGERPGAPP